MKKGLCVFLVLTLALTALCFPALAQEEGKVLNIWCWNGAGMTNSRAASTTFIPR